MDNLTDEERNAIRELKIRTKSVLPLNLMEDEDVFIYRFLRARDFSLDNAEKMLRKHIQWMKVYQVEKYLENFKPKEVFVKYIEPRHIGFDKNGDAVRYSQSGKINGAEYLKCMKLCDERKHWIWFAERSKWLFSQRPENMGRMHAVVGIIDLDGLEFGNATSKASADIYIAFTEVMQDHYPEGMKSVYVINAPSYYIIIFTILKALMSNRMSRKIHVFGSSGWKEKLLEFIDADVLPAFLGGKRTDPNGDPYCRSSVPPFEKIPERYYLSDEERYFKDPNDISTLLIPPSAKKEILVHVKEVGSSIQWKFLVKSKTIKFGLFFQESQSVLKEIIPLYEYHTPDGTEDGSYKCFDKGKYIVIFDNSSSRFTSKEVRYVISVEKSEV